MKTIGTERILRRYGIAGSVVSEEELCGGNVNLTYKVTVRDGASFKTYLVQKINANALPSAKDCARNMALVTDHLERHGIRTPKLYAVGRSGERFVSEKNAFGVEEEWRIEEYLSSKAHHQPLGELHARELLAEVVYDHKPAACADVFDNRVHELYVVAVKRVAPTFVHEDELGVQDVVAGHVVGTSHPPETVPPVQFQQPSEDRFAMARLLPVPAPVVGNVEYIPRRSHKDDLCDTQSQHAT